MRTTTTSAGLTGAETAAYGFLGAAALAIFQAAASPVLLSIGPSRGVHEGLNLLTDLLALYGFSRLWAARACGNSLAGRIGLGLAIFGAVATLVAQSFEALGQPVSGTLFEFVVTPTSTIGLWIAAVTMIVARCWTGWHRFSLLPAAIWFLPFALSHVVIPLGPGRFIALAIWGLCYLALGLALRAEARSPGPTA